MGVAAQPANKDGKQNTGDSKPNGSIGHGDGGLIIRSQNNGFDTSISGCNNSTKAKYPKAYHPFSDQSILKKGC